jgi:high-affinity nickel-transport protein
MRGVKLGFLDDRNDHLRLKIAGIYIVLIAANAAVWGMALVAFRHNPALLGTALVAYILGLRHAVDADHIAAIDNVTRKLMQDGQRPLGTGCYFALGHSTVVVLTTLAVALGAGTLEARFAGLRDIGAIIGTGVSAGFLIIIAGLNLVILAGTWRTLQRVRAAGHHAAPDQEMLASPGGALTRLLQPLLRFMSRSWHMYPLGFLFGLSFDTATEIALIGLSATSAAHGMSLWSILVFPALFTAGMSLVDTSDGILMLGAYGWASVKPIRKLYYNMTVTLVSVVVALLVGGIETLGLLQIHLDLTGRFWDAIGRINGNFGVIGVSIIAVFAVSWIGSALIHRMRGSIGWRKGRSRGDRAGWSARPRLDVQ